MQNIFCFKQFFDCPQQSFSFIDKEFEKVSNKFWSRAYALSNFRMNLYDVIINELCFKKHNGNTDMTL